jgi:hypothetical protein
MRRVSPGRSLTDRLGSSMRSMHLNRLRYLGLLLVRFTRDSSDGKLYGRFGGREERFGQLAEGVLLFEELLDASVVWIEVSGLQRGQQFGPLVFDRAVAAGELPSMHDFVGQVEPAVNFPGFSDRQRRPLQDLGFYPVYVVAISLSMQSPWQLLIDDAVRLAMIRASSRSEHWGRSISISKM